MRPTPHLALPLFVDADLTSSDMHIFRFTSSNNCGAHQCAPLAVKGEAGPGAVRGLGGPGQQFGYFDDKRDICKFVSFSHGRVFDRSSGKDELGIRYLADNPRNEAEFVAEDCLRNKLI